MAREIDYVNPYDLTIIGLDTEDGADHPLYDERVYLPVDENLVKNIQVYAIQQPVLVRKDGDTLLVVDGRQRVRAARLAWDQATSAGEHPIKVPTRTVTATDARATGIMISSNELRQEDDVLGKALKAQRLYAQYGDIGEVAIAFGRSTQTIRNWLLLVEADPKVHECIRSQKLSVTTAIEIARLKREEQREKLESFLRAAENGKISDKAVREALVETDYTASTMNQGDEAKAKPERKSGKSHNQQGVKRTWLRKALDTEAGESLTDEQRAVMMWFCTGECSESDWFAEFQSLAQEEMQKGGRKRKPAVMPKINSRFEAKVEVEEIDDDEDDMEDEDLGATISAILANKN